MSPAKMNSEEIKKEVGDFIDQNWDVNSDLISWRKKLLASGFAAPDWPSSAFGRDYDRAATEVVAQVFREQGIIGAAKTGPRSLAAATILAHGDNYQKSRFLEPILTGEESWCQLFSEPGSGSDLAGSTTRADETEDGWRINGQKVWTTSAHHADYGILLARTDWDLPKHQGLSYFLIDMRQAAIEVRPLKQMNGHASFNEVFMEDAFVPKENLVGQLGEGWVIAQTTLTVERRGFSRLNVSDGTAGKTGPIYDAYRAEVAEANEPYTWYPSRAGRADLAFKRAQASGKIHEPHVRDALAKLLYIQKAATWTAMRAAENRHAKGPESSVGKIAASRLAQQANHVHTLVTDTESMLAGSEAAEAGTVAEVLLSTPAISIAGGTDEIQKNIIAERVLGLPKEPRFDTGPFREVKRNT